jgi:predicted nucleic acid-binding protein
MSELWLDTNILLRLITRDPPDQAARALRLAVRLALRSVVAIASCPTVKSISLGAVLYEELPPLQLTYVPKMVLIFITFWEL